MTYFLAGILAGIFLMVAWVASATPRRRRRIISDEMADVQPPDPQTYAAWRIGVIDSYKEN
jgi:hypothetical protein